MPTRHRPQSMPSQTELKTVHYYFKIAAAIINKFHPVIVDPPDAVYLMQAALQRLNHRCVEHSQPCR